MLRHDAFENISHGKIVCVCIREGNKNVELYIIEIIVGGVKEDKAEKRSP